MSSNYNESVINTKILINYFHELCEDFWPPYKEENTVVNREILEYNKKILIFLERMKVLINNGRCHAQTFRTGICKMKKLDVIHIEIFWYLEVAKLVSLQEVIKHHEDNNNEEVLQYITQSVLELLLEYKTKPSTVRKEMLIDYIKTLFDNSENNLKSGQIVLHLIVSNIKESFSSNDVLPETVNISTVIELLNDAKLNSFSIQLFCHQILNFLLEGSTQSMYLVLKKQQTKKNNTSNNKLFSFFKEISQHCEINGLVEVLKTYIFEKFECVNWDNMLMFVMSLGIHYKDGWSSLKKLSDQIIKESLNSSNSKLLSSAFLIARQGCFEKANNSFPSYIQWFSSNFSSESKRPLNSKQICSFFFNFLNDLIPYDAPYYLKVHINRQPWVPMDCQSFLTDYTNLAKNRLSDLNISIELGICDNTTDKSAAVFDVENVIDYFSRTNEIMNSVFQTSMFCKDYFEKKFLVELLSKFEGKKSDRHKLIVKLHSVGKVPNSMFKSYKSLEKKK